VDGPVVEVAFADDERVAAELVFHARLVHAACAALLGEARVRQETMSRAQDTAERRITDQERALRRARQERTTQEMLEVLGGRRSIAQP